MPFIIELSDTNVRVDLERKSYYFVQIPNMQKVVGMTAYLLISPPQEKSRGSADGSSPKALRLLMSCNVAMRECTPTMTGLIVLNLTHKNHSIMSRMISREPFCRNDGS